MSKISIADYFAMLADLSVPEERIVEYSIVVRGEGGFDFELAPNPEKVELTQAEAELESAMKIGNGLCRWRRKVAFRNRLNSGEKLPVLVSEGDSWFQFPLLIRDVIHQLGNEYLIYSVGAAGDTAANIVYDPKAQGGNEYMAALGDVRAHVKGFLFSAAGNDIIGEDPKTGVASLYDIVRTFNGDVNDVHGHINHNVLEEKLGFLRKAYKKVIADLRADADFARLPVIIHGYDYAFPFPHGASDPRKPIYAAKDEWLGEPLTQRKIMNSDLRWNIIGTS